jgi:hypothetical protein
MSMKSQSSLLITTARKATQKMLMISLNTRSPNISDFDFLRLLSLGNFFSGRQLKKKADDIFSIGLLQTRSARIVATKIGYLLGFDCVH